MSNQQDISSLVKLQSLYMRSIHNASSLGDKVAGITDDDNNQGRISIALLLYAMQRRGVLSPDFEARLSVDVSDEMFKIVKEIEDASFVCPEYDDMTAKMDTYIKNAQPFSEGEK